MKEKFLSIAKKDKNFFIKLTILIVLFFINLFYYRGASFTTVGDDEVYRTSIETWGTWWNWAKAYYLQNSGRVIIHTLLIIVTNLPIWIFRCLSAGMLTMTCCSLYRISCINKANASWKKLLLIVVVFCATVFSISEIGASIKWASGALNYLYPVCAFLLVLIPFTAVISGVKISKIWKVVSCMAVFLCGNMEQSSAIIIVLGILVVLYLLIVKPNNVEKGDTNFLVVLWLINLCVFVVSYAAPGVAERYSAELLRCCGYSMFSLPQKVVLGIQIFTLYLFSFRGLFVWLLPTIASLFVFYKGKNRRGLFLCVLNVILCGTQNILIRKVFDIQFVHFYNTGYNIWIVFTCFLILLSGFIIVLALKELYDKYWFGFLFLGAFVAGVVPAFSPTLFVSAGRTMYISYIVLILIAIKIVTQWNYFVELPTNKKYQTLIYRGYIVIGVALSLVVVTGFVMSYKIVKKADLEEYTLTNQYNISDINVDNKKGEVSANIAVEQFFYVADNWCSGSVPGYDINIKLGIVNEDSGVVREYQTKLITKYPVMDEYENGFVDFVGYCKEDIDLHENEKFIILICDHDGDMYYQYI